MLLYAVCQWIPHVVMICISLEDDGGRLHDVSNSSANSSSTAGVGDGFKGINLFIGAMATTVFIFVALVYSFTESIKADNRCFACKLILIVTAFDLFDSVEMLEFNMLPVYDLPGGLRHAITAFAILLFLSSVIALYVLSVREDMKKKNRGDLIVSGIGLLVNIFFMAVRLRRYGIPS